MFVITLVVFRYFALLKMSPFATCDILFVSYTVVVTQNALLLVKIPPSSYLQGVTVYFFILHMCVTSLDIVSICRMFLLCAHHYQKSIRPELLNVMLRHHIKMLLSHKGIALFTCLLF